MSFLSNMFGGGDAPPPTPVAVAPTPSPAPPSISDADVAGLSRAQTAAQRAKKGVQSTMLTSGGLGDTGTGDSAQGKTQRTSLLGGG